MTKDIEVVEATETPKSTSKPTKSTPTPKRSANSDPKSDKAAPPKKKRGTRSDNNKENELFPLPAGYESDHGEDSDADSHRSPSPATSECPEIIQLRKEVKDIATTVKVLADNLATYVTGVQNLVNPIQDDLKKLNTGITYRNQFEQNQLSALVRDATQLVKDLKDHKDKPSSTRYIEQLTKMEKNISGIFSGVSTSFNIISNIQAFLVGCTTGPRFALQPMDTTPVRPSGVFNPLHTSAEAPRPKVCKFCIDKTRNTHNTLDCGTYSSFVDRLTRAHDLKFCTKCTEDFDDTGDHIHKMCPQTDIVCDPCTAMFGATASTNHSQIFCPLRKASNKKAPKERSSHSKGDKGPGKPHNYMAGAFNH